MSGGGGGVLSSDMINIKAFRQYSADGSAGQPSRCTSHPGRHARRRRLVPGRAVCHVRLRGRRPLARVEYLRETVPLQPLEAPVQHAHPTDVLHARRQPTAAIRTRTRLPLRELASQKQEGAYLIDFDHNQQIMVRQIDFVGRPDKRRNELDDAVASKGVVVAQGRPDGELWRQC